MFADDLLYNQIEARFFFEAFSILCFVLGPFIFQSTTLTYIIILFPHINI